MKKVIIIKNFYVCKQNTNDFDRHRHFVFIEKKESIWEYSTVSWSNVDIPYLIPTLFFKDGNNKKDGFTDRKNISSLAAKQSLNQCLNLLIPNIKEECRNCTGNVDIRPTHGTVF